MIGQLSTRRESLAAEITDEISSLQIGFMDFLHVSLKVANLLEQFAALLTAELLHSGVDEVVGLQLVLQSELLVAARLSTTELTPGWS